MTKEPQTTRSPNYIAGYHQALEDAAKMVETHLAYPCLKGRKIVPISGKGRLSKSGQPRHAYAEAIRAMKNNES